MMSSEYDFEPVPGLPERLPAGEALLWQGAPSWTGIARSVFHAGLVCSYFVVLMALRLWSSLSSGENLESAFAGAAGLLPVAVAALALIGLLGYLTARTTIYTITSKRVVMRFGIAMPLTVNVPYAVLASADLKINRDLTGDIALQTQGSGRLAYLHLWPHARPWHVSPTQPMLRCLQNPHVAANILSKALAAAVPSGVRTAVSEQPQREIQSPPEAVGMAA